MSIIFKKNKIKFLITFIIIVVIAVFIFLSLKSRSENIDCTSTFYINPADKSWSYIKGTMSVTLIRGNNLGEVMFSGEAKNNDHLRRFERVISFTYTKPEANQFILSDIVTRKYSNDDLDDIVFSDYVYSSSASGRDHLVILKIRNAFLIGSMIGPRYLCVKRLK